MNACKTVAAGLVAGISLVAQVLMLSTEAFAEHKYSEWGPVVNLGCGTINSASDDQGPAVSKNGLSLYFGSARAGGIGGRDLYVAQRASPELAWGMPRNLDYLDPTSPTVNSPLTDNAPSFSRDGHWMFFNSNRTGSVGDVDLWASYRALVHDDFAWEPPFNLGPGVNTLGFDGGASYFENEEGGTPQLFYGSGSSLAESDIWVAELRPDGTFGNARRVAELSTDKSDQRPSIRFDGLEMFFYSDRPGSTPNDMGDPSNDIWVATRNSVNESWGTPVNVNLGSMVNTGFSDITPHISADGQTLYFASNRPSGEPPIPGCGGNDLYKTTRTKLKGKD